MLRLWGKINKGDYKYVKYCGSGESNHEGNYKQLKCCTFGKKHLREIISR